MDTAMPNFGERAAKGATFLDSRNPGWYKDIEIGILDMHSVFDCVLGQVFGDFFIAVEDLGLLVLDTYDYGFDIPVREQGTTVPNSPLWRALESSWKAEINKRRENANV